MKTEVTDAMNMICIWLLGSETLPWDDVRESRAIKMRSEGT
jgi:hypothetical protein